MLAFVRKHWAAFLAVAPLLPSIWRGIVGLLDWGGRVDLIASKLHEAGGVSGIGGFLLSPPPWIIWPALVMTVALLLWDKQRNETETEPRHRRVSFWGPWILIVGGPLIGIVWLLLQKPSVDKVEPRPWTWEWTPLTTQQADDLYRLLKDHPKQTAMTACDSNTCAAVANSWAQVFLRLDWKYQGNLSNVRPNVKGLTGITLIKDEGTSELKEKIERVTGIEVHVRADPRPATCVIVFGGKPLPEKLSEEIQSDIRDLGKRLQQSSQELLNFAVDRTREYGAAPLSDPAKFFDKNKAFREETAILMEQRFGDRLRVDIARLSEMGVEMAWQVRVSKESDPGTWAKWLGSVGRLLEQGDIVRARKMAADEDFWFRQHTNP